MIRKVQQRAQQIVSGFKSPADDYLEGRLDITDQLVVDPHCTFYFRMGSTNMLSYRIPEGAILVVDRSLTAADTAVVIASLEGELVCMTYRTSAFGIRLISDVREVVAREGIQIEVWGVVTAVCYGLLPEELRKGRYRYVCTV